MLDAERLSVPRPLDQPVDQPIGGAAAGPSGFLTFDDPRLPRRFWERCIPEPMSGCWLWLGRVTTDPNRSGQLAYGIFDVQLASGGFAARKAHRVAFEAQLGAHVPSGLELDHRCRLRLCCNPSHLEAVTHLENMGRGAMAMRTACPQGHEYSPENTLVQRARGGRTFQRVCRACRRERAAARRARASAPCNASQAGKLVASPGGC